MSLGFETGPLKNPNVCSDAYAPSFWLGKPGALTQVRMPDAGWSRSSTDNFAVHNLLDGMATDRSPYLRRVWQFSHQWIKPDVMSVFMEYATRQRGVGPFVLIDPQMKNLLTPNQASGTDSLHTSEGFRADQLGTNVAFFDEFGRTVASNWGTSDSGVLWIVDGTAAQYSVAGGVGVHSVAALNTMYRSRTASPIIANGSIVAQSMTAVAPVGNYQRSEVAARLVDTINYYALRIHRIVGGAIDIQMIRVLGGIESTLAAVTSTYATHTAGVGLWIELATIGTTLSGRVWRTDQLRPATAELTATDSSFAQGSFSLSSLLPSGNTNTLPFAMNYDSVTVTNLGVVNALASSTDDAVQGERSLSWTMSPPVTGTSTTLHVTTPTGLYGFCVPPTSQSSKRVAFSGYVKLASTSLDNSAQVTPQIVFMNGSGAVQSTLSGAVITAVTGTAGSGWQTFCVTGSVPTGTAGMYLEPQFVALNSTMTAQTTFLFDMLQLEIIDGTTCTQWEYGQGQPLVSVRSDSESVPRILRTSMNFIAVEVTT